MLSAYYNYDNWWLEEKMTTNQDFGNMLQAFLTAQQNVAQEQQNMMRQFLAEQSRARTAQHDRRTSQAPASAEISDSEIDDVDSDHDVRDKGKLISKHITPDRFSGDMAK